MSIEAKVGGFVLAGLALLGWAIFLLGDVSLQRHYPLYVTFSDVGGLPDKALVKLSGVEVGNVKTVELEQGKVRLELAVKKGVEIYKDAIFRIGSTSVIGSKYLEIQQGHPFAGVIPEGGEVRGQDTVPLERAITDALSSVQKLLGDVGDNGRLGRNLNAAVDNLRQTSITMNELLSEIKPSIASAGKRMDGITEKLDRLLAKADQAMAKVDSMMGQGNEVMTKINTSTAGTVGALIGDQKMKDDVRQTVSDVKATAGNLKDMLTRIDAFRISWSYNNRYDFLAKTSRGDVGLKISPREGRYYYVGLSNIGSNADKPLGREYEPKNNLDAQLGWMLPRLDFHVGMIKGAGGLGFEWAPLPGFEKLKLFTDAFDWMRNRQVNDKFLKGPEVDVGARYQIHRMVSLGARVQDATVLPRVETDAQVVFEDKDIAYFLGLIAFGSTTSKSSKSN